MNCILSLLPLALQVEMDRDTLNVQRLVRSLEREMQRPLSAAASDVVMIEVSGDASETTNGSDNDAYYTTMATLTVSPSLACLRPCDDDVDE